MPRISKLLPENRADYSFGDLLYFHLFKQGTRAKGPHALWEMESICPLTGISERVLRNWINGPNLPNNFPSQLADELFARDAEGQKDRAELQTKFEEGWAKKRQNARAAAPAAVPASGSPSLEKSGKGPENRAEIPATVIPTSVDNEATIIVPPVPGAGPTSTAHPKSRRGSVLALTVILLLAAGGITAWRLGLIAPLDAGPPSVTPPSVKMVTPLPAPVDQSPALPVAPAPTPPPVKILNSADCPTFPFQRVNVRLVPALG